MLGKAKLLLYYASFDTWLLSSVLLHKSVFLLTQLKCQNVQSQLTESPASE